MFKEYDIIVSKRNFENIPSGSEGVILIVHETFKDFLIEFFDNKGKTIDVITVNEKDIELKQSYKR